MNCPAQSPDLNVIENIWLYIKRKLEVRIHKINSNNDLFREIFCIWQTIPLTYSSNLYDSIPSRILNVIRLKGHLTKFYFFTSFLIDHIWFYCDDAINCPIKWQPYMTNIGQSSVFTIHTSNAKKQEYIKKKIS